MFRKIDKTLKYIIYPLPIWWLLGLEQILIWFLGIYALLNFMNDKNKLLKYNELLLVAFFLLTFVSTIFVSDPSRLFESIRSTIAFSLLIFGSRELGKIVTNKGRLRILKYTYIIYLWSVFSAAVSYILPDFTIIAPIEIIIPESLKKYSLVQNLYYKNLGDYYFSLFGEFWRPTGTYSYSTGLSNTLVLLLPLVLLYRTYIHGNKNYINLSIIMGVLIVIMTTTRMSIIVLVCLAFYLGVFVYKEFRKLILVLLSISFIIVLYLIDFFEIYRTFMEIRGGGSLDFRMSLYLTTLDYFLVKPIFGWGAQIPHPGFYAALGSHSGYLNTLLCYGIVGFTLFYSGLVKSVFYLNFKQKKELLILGSWLVFLLISFTQVFHTDFITVLVFTLLLAITTNRKDLRSFKIKLK